MSARCPNYSCVATTSWGHGTLLEALDLPGQVRPPLGAVLPGTNMSHPVTR